MYSRFVCQGNSAEQCFCSMQEEDVIGHLAKNEKIAALKPLGDRILIQVRSRMHGGIYMVPTPGCMFQFAHAKYMDGLMYAHGNHTMLAFLGLLAGGLRMSISEVLVTQHLT